ncbi:hypothetical protein LSH36_230g04019 [Paralvinella palmiformis]|uniref:Protein FMC1 homolog n=1 Tax=Paralvinella palmiformis TaxID=53620 RepID=A0AAD9JNS2_9ANNE|nr:hypothetical protein LSH36_230g04019 [Paralvinella palmiformis]
MRKLSNLQLLRRLLQELRHISHKKPVKDNLMYPLVMSQFHENQLTEKRICRGENEMRHMALTYLCLLESLRKRQNISQFYNKGEISVEEAAKLVGLSLPLKPPQH